MRSIRLSVIPLLLCILSIGVVTNTGCAVKKEQCIGCSSETLWRLNIGAELQSDQNQYKQFFKDVGDSQRQGLLSNNDVANLNIVGTHLKTVLDNAAVAYKAYVSAPDNDKKQQVINLVLAAEQIFIQLTTTKTNMVVKSGGGN